MTQELDLTPSSAALGLDPWFSGDPLVITGTVPSTPTMSSWRMQLWKRPHDINTDGAEPLATAIGTVASGVLTVIFAPSQVTYDALELSDVIGNNNYWLTVGGVSSEGYRRLIRAGSVEFLPAPFDEDAASSTPVTYTVTDDVITFDYDGTTYSFPVSPIGVPTGAVEGQVVVIDDVGVFTTDGVSYSFPVAMIDEVPTPEDTSVTVDYIVGTDGATYERTTTAAGAIYYKPVFTAAP